MQARRLLIFLTILNLINYIDRWIVAAVIPSMQGDLGFSNTTAGLIMSAFMLGYFLTSPLFGYLTDRLNRVKLIFFGTSLWSVATLFSGFGQGATQVFAARTAVGVGEASLISASPSLVADAYPPKNLNFAMTVLSATIPVGSALGFIFGGLIAHAWGWRWAFFMAGIPGLLVALLLIALVKEPLRGAFDDFKKVQESDFIKDICTLLANSKYRNVVFGYAAYTFTVGGFASWAPKYLVAVRDIDLKTADTWFGALTVAMGFLGTIFGGWLSNHFLKKRPRGDLWVAVLVTILAIPLTFGAFLFSSQFYFFSSIALAEFFLFASQPAVNVAIVESVGPFLRGIASAVSIFTIHLLGDFISPPLVGFVSDQSNLKIGVLILPTALFLSVFFYWRSYKEFAVRPEI